MSLSRVRLLSRRLSLRRLWVRTTPDDARIDRWARLLARRSTRRGVVGGATGFGAWLAVRPRGAAGVAVQSGGDVPDAYLGEWAGGGIQSDPPSEWPIELSLWGGDLGEIAGQSRYPSFGCVADLILDYVTEFGPDLIESLTVDPGGICLDGGTLALTLDPFDPDALGFIYTHPGGTGGATGTLYRNGASGAIAAPGTGQGISSGEFQLSYELTVLGTPPAGTVFFASLDMERAALHGGFDQLLDPDGDGIYTDSAPLTYTVAAGAVVRAWIYQGTGLGNELGLGDVPLDPVIVAEWGPETVDADRVFAAEVSFDQSPAGSERPTLTIELTVTGTPPPGTVFVLEETGPDAGFLSCTELIDVEGTGIYSTSDPADSAWPPGTPGFTFYGGRIVAGTGLVTPAFDGPQICLESVERVIAEAEPVEITGDTVLPFTADYDGAPPGGDPVYTVTDLGTLGGWSRASALNGYGQVVGTSVLLPDPTAPDLYRQHAFVWSGGAMIDLGTLNADAQSSEAYGINDAGQIAGDSDSIPASSLPGPLPHAVVWADGVPRSLGTLAGNASHANAINNLGHVVGLSRLESAAGPIHAFLWDGATMTDLGLLGGDYSAARAINDEGVVAGVTGTPSGQSHACRWRLGAIDDLGTLPGHDASIAYACNNANLIVGTSSPPSNGHPDQPVDACLWDDGGINYLAPLPGANQSYAYGVNDDGVIVGASGRYGGNDPSGDLRACLWRDERIADLNDLIAPDSGWTLLEATAINAIGQIAGNGRIGGADHAFLLTPIGTEPPGGQPSIPVVVPPGSSNPGNAPTTDPAPTGPIPGNPGNPGNPGIDPIGQRPETVVDPGPTQPQEPVGIVPRGQQPQPGPSTPPTRVETPPPTPARDLDELIAAIRQTRELAQSRLRGFSKTASTASLQGEYFAKAYPEDAATVVADLIVNVAGIIGGRVVDAGVTRLVAQPGFQAGVRSATSTIVRSGQFPAVSRLLLPTSTNLNVQKEVIGLTLKPLELLAAEAGTPWVQDDAARILRGVLSGGDAHGEFWRGVRDLALEGERLLDETETYVLERITTDEAGIASALEHLKLIRQANLIADEIHRDLALPLGAAYAGRLQEEQEPLAENVIRALRLTATYAAYCVAGPLGFLVETGLTLADLWVGMAKLDEDVRMAQAGLDIVWGGHQAAAEVLTNTLGAITLVTFAAGENAPRIPQGAVKLAGHADRAGERRSNLTVTNSGALPATFAVMAQYDSDPDWWGEIGRHRLPADRLLTLQPGETGQVRLSYERGDTGKAPRRGSEVTLELLATTETGRYRLKRSSITWNP